MSMPVKPWPEEKRELWAKNFREAKEVDLTIGEFCELHGVGKSMYYYYRQMVGGDLALTELRRSPPKGPNKGGNKKKAMPQSNPKPRPLFLDQREITYPLTAQPQPRYGIPNPSYQQVPLEEDYSNYNAPQPIPPGKPLFCLLLAFESKAEALKAMERYL